MIKDEIYPKINDLVNHFEKLARDYRAMELTLYTHPTIYLEGFSRCLKNESKERWETSEWICKFLKTNSRKVTLGNITNSKQDFQTAQEIFTYAVGLENATVEAINSLITESIKIEDYNTESFLKRLLCYCIEEQKEVKKIHSILTMWGDNHTILIMKDKELYDEYSPNKYYEKYSKK